MEYTHRLSIAEMAPYQTAESGFMGAFTADPLCVQRLLGAGIPVWFICRDSSALDKVVVELLTILARAESIPLAEWQEGAPPVYSGLVGEVHLASICRRALTYADVSRAPLLIWYDVDMYCIDAHPRDEQNASGRVVQDRNNSSASTRDARAATGPTRNTRRTHNHGTGMPPSQS